MQKEDNRSKKIRKGDRVIAIAGNDRGQIGNVLSIIGNKAVVQGLNVRKKHVKRSEQQPQGGIVELEKPIPLCKLKPCVENDRPVKLKVRIAKNGERELMYKLDGQEILHRSVKKS
jgi:large subunit ribosomal protein L24